jgi:putative transposase
MQPGAGPCPCRRCRACPLCRPRPFRPTTTIPGTGNVPDLLARDFTATAPGTKLCGDITYIRTWQGWMATVLDCYTKECIGWAIADHVRTELITDAVNMAARNRVLAPRAIFHSDRGAQYMSADFTARRAELNLRRSVGRTGVCWDNAWAESFNAAVKVERVNRTEYPTKRHAITDVAQYIELRYNTIRLHSALGYRTPREMHDEYYEAKIAA